MKFVCLGYIAPRKLQTMPESERNAMLDACFNYDAVLRSGGHYAGGEALQPAESAKTLRWKNGKVLVTDGPYAETKEQIGGILLLEARDLNHAVRLMRNHPGVAGGPFEIRPLADLGAMVEASARRRKR